MPLNLGHFAAKLHRSRDGGTTWEEKAVPVYPPQPENLPKPENEFAKVAPWSLVQIWSLESHGGAKADGLWAGTIPGGLFHSADGAQSWRMIRTLWAWMRKIGLGAWWHFATAIVRHDMNHSAANPIFPKGLGQRLAFHIDHLGSQGCRERFQIHASSIARPDLFS